MNRKQCLRKTKSQLFLALAKSDLHHKRTIREIQSALNADVDIPASVLHHLNHILRSYGKKPIINKHVHERYELETRETNNAATKGSAMDFHDAGK